MWKQTSVGLLAFLVGTAAQAQFAGDVYFAAPSIAVAEGSVGEMEVVTFSGSEPVGAVHVEVLFDPAALEVIDIAVGSAPELQGGFVYEALEPGRVAFVGLNSRSLTNPFGTVSLARIEVRPVSAAGSRVPLTISVQQVLNTDSQAVRAQGFAGEVVVTSPVGAASSAGTLSVATRSVAPPPLRSLAQPSLESRASTMARPGETVEIMRLEQYPQGVGATGMPVTVPVEPSIESGR
jgi:hypothetical protein